MLASLMDALNDLSRDLPLIFPVHPRTQQRLNELNGRCVEGRVQLVDPLGYLDFLSLQQEAAFVITDSGGIQEETTYLGIPCLTVRENTERPVTVTCGTNMLVGQDRQRLRTEVRRILAGGAKQGHIPPLWDGHAAERLADVIVRQ
jgi:UDP-N-acetylglucosamine 2-epimerase (non-hydrolysing)